jgi:hypothetical protein
MALRVFGNLALGKLGLQAQVMQAAAASAMRAYSSSGMKGLIRTSELDTASSLDKIGSWAAAAFARAQSHQTASTRTPTSGPRWMATPPQLAFLTTLRCGRPVHVFTCRDVVHPRGLTNNSGTTR